MKTQAREAHEMHRLQPLLRSIQAEITERTALIRDLETRLASFAKTPRIHDEDIRSLQAELSTQRRELRNVERELARLGVQFDAEHPHQIVDATPALTSSGG